MAVHKHVMTYAVKQYPGKGGKMVKAAPEPMVVVRKGMGRESVHNSDHKLKQHGGGMR